jgi:hypothetical protein
MKRLAQKKEKAKKRHAELMKQNKKLVEILSKDWIKLFMFRIFTKYIYI